MRQLVLDRVQDRLRLAEAEREAEPVPAVMMAAARPPARMWRDRGRSTPAAEPGRFLVMGRDRGVDDRAAVEKLVHHQPGEYAARRARAARASSCSTWRRHGDQPRLGGIGRDSVDVGEIPADSRSISWLRW